MFVSEGISDHGFDGTLVCFVKLIFEFKRLMIKKSPVIFIVFCVFTHYCFKSMSLQYLNNL